MADSVMSVPTIIFRADGNAQLGLGHLMRCLALVDMLGPDFDCRFAVHQPTPAIETLFRQNGRLLMVLQTAEVTEFLTHVGPQDCVVLDGYLFDSGFQRAVKSRCRRLVFIDDWVRGFQVADLVVNHTAGVAQTDYHAGPHTQFLLGPHYALVNPLFRATPPVLSSQTVFVCLGGADPLNLTRQIAGQLATHHPGTPVRVALGGANPHGPSFATLPPNRVTLLRGLTVAAMAREIEQCRVAIVSCSTVAYEVATVGRPFIGLLTADNQARLARFLAGQSLAVGVLSLPPDLEQLSFLLNQLAPEQGVANQRRYLDGQAGSRFRAAFQHLLA